MRSRAAVRALAGIVYPSSPAVFALGIKTSAPLTSSASVAPLTAFTSETIANNRSVQLSAFPLAASRRRAAGCAPGTVWRYVRQGVPVTAQTACFPECANAQCTGATTCAVVPAAGDVWQVVPAPAGLCAVTTPAPTNATLAAATPPPPPGWAPDLAQGLGLGLGIGIPALLGGAVLLRRAFFWRAHKPAPEYYEPGKLAVRPGLPPHADLVCI